MAAPESHYMNSHRWQWPFPLAELNRILAVTVMALTMDRGFTSPAAEPANPDTNPKARAVLNYIESLPQRSDKRLISGQFCGAGPAAKFGPLPRGLREVRPLARDDRPRLRRLRQGRHLDRRCQPTRHRLRPARRPGYDQRTPVQPGQPERRRPSRRGVNIKELLDPDAATTAAG